MIICNVHICCVFSNIANCGCFFRTRGCFRSNCPCLQHLAGLEWGRPDLPRWQPLALIASPHWPAPPPLVSPARHLLISVYPARATQPHSVPARHRAALPIGPVPLSHSRRDRGTSLGTDPKISNDPRDPQLDVSGRAGGRLLIGADISRWDDSDLTTILEKEGRLF